MCVKFDLREREAFDDAFGAGVIGIEGEYFLVSLEGVIELRIGEVGIGEFELGGDVGGGFEGSSFEIDELICMCYGSEEQRCE